MAHVLCTSNHQCSHVLDVLATFPFAGNFIWTRNNARISRTMLCWLQSWKFGTFMLWCSFKLIKSIQIILVLNVMLMSITPATNARVTCLLPVIVLICDCMAGQIGTHSRLYYRGHLFHDLRHVGHMQTSKKLSVALDNIVEQAEIYRYNYQLLCSFVVA